MDKFDRIQQLHRIFTAHRRPVPLRTLAERLECSERNVRRIIATMQNLLDAPIEYSREHNGWRYIDTPDNRFELLGLWLTGKELQSLTLLLSILESLGRGLLNSELAPMEREVHRLLKARGISVSAFTERIRVLPLGNRRLPDRIFHTVGKALLQGKQVQIRYKSFAQKDSKRTLSPQNLVFYRENWYLDAWCHLREGLRTFSIARISAAELVNTRAKKISKATLNSHFADSYGIFAGPATQWARLRFNGEIAHEVALQHWHPYQRGCWEAGDYVMELPYSDHRELTQDILRHMPFVVVESPPELRREVITRMKAGLDRMQGTASEGAG